MKLTVSTTRRETALGWSYLLVSMFVLPFALGFVSALLTAPLSETVLNLIFFALNFICVAVIFHKFLAASVREAVNNPWRCLRSAAIGFVLYYLALTLFSRVTFFLDPDFSNVNDANIMQLTQEFYPLMVFATVFLVPITEETLYRGLLFQGLFQKSRLAAYLVSMLVFSAIHIIGYVGTADIGTLLLCFVQYLPAGFTLAWAYEQADTIVAPMLMHITINLIGISALR